MKWPALLILVVAILAGGCALIPQTQAVADEPLIFNDGSEAAKGDKIYEDAKGDATAHELDPTTGEPNKPFRVNDVARLEKYKEQADKVASGLPPPLNWIGGGIIAVLGAGGIAAAAVANRRKLAQAGAKPKGKA